MSAQKADRGPVKLDDSIGSAVMTSKAPRMTQGEITWLIAHAVRSPAIALCAVGPTGIKPGLFDRSETAFLLLWKSAASVLVENGNVLPTDVSVAKQMVGLRCLTEIATDGASRLFYTPSVEMAVLAPGGMLDEMFALPVTEETEEKGLSLLCKFLVERSMSDPIRVALSGVGPHDTLTNPMAVVDAMERRARELVGLAVDPGESLVTGSVEGWRPEGRVVRSSSRKFIDNLIGGGYARGEAYAISGVTSGGKSCLASNLIIDACENETAAVVELGNPSIGGHWYYFTYELSSKQLKYRMHAYGAKITFDSFTGELSTSENPASIKPYEREPWVNSPGNPVMGELERLHGFRRRFQEGSVGDRLHVVDYSGAQKGHGCGGVEEIHRYLRREQARGRRIAGFVVDYAGVLVSRQIDEQRIDPRSEYFMLKALGDKVRNQICVPMDCTAIVLHQLHGDSGRKPSGAKQHHSANLGCHNFADNFDYGIQFGMYNGVTGLLSLHCSKHRSSARNEDGVIARFDGRFGAFLDPEDDYTMDPFSGQIVRRDFLDQMPTGPIGPAGMYKPGRIVDPSAGAD